MADQSTLTALGPLVDESDTVHALLRSRRMSPLATVLDTLTMGVFSDGRRFSELDRRWVLVTKPGSGALVTLKDGQVVDVQPVPGWSAVSFARSFDQDGHRYRVLNRLD